MKGHDNANENPSQESQEGRSEETPGAGSSHPSRTRGSTHENRDSDGVARVAGTEPERVGPDSLEPFGGFGRVTELCTGLVTALSLGETAMFNELTADAIEDQILAACVIQDLTSWALALAETVEDQGGEPVTSTVQAIRHAANKLTEDMDGE